MPYGYVLANVEELVVASFVDIVLGQSTFRIGLAESLDSETTDYDMVRIRVSLGCQSQKIPAKPRPVAPKNASRRPRMLI